MLKLLNKAVFRLSAILRNSNIQGNLDGYIDGALNGWLRDTESDGPVVVDVDLVGIVTHQNVVCDLRRDDLLVAGVGTGAHGFRIPLDLLEISGDVDVVVRLAGHTRVVLAAKVNVPVSPTLIRAMAVRQEPDIGQNTLHRYRVEIEEVSAHKCVGWAVDTLDPTSVFDIEVVVDGLTFCSFSNDLQRSDLLHAKLSMGQGGFLVPLPRGLFHGRSPQFILCLPLGEQISVDFEAAPVVREFSLPTKSETAPLSIIVPVYNAFEDTKVCMERLQLYTPPDVEIIIINDASSDPRIAKLLADHADHTQFQIFENADNMGFTRTVTRGILEAGNRDVIFLNSDARVTPNWVEGLRAAATSDYDIGTITPLSDRAGAFSAPQIGNRNPLPDGVTEADFSVAVRRHSLRIYPTVPTGNGFCMYVRRVCLDAVGLLDETAFPRGYGEENDFCMRARDLGWRSVIDDATYVFHERSKSFGAEKTDLIAEGRKVVGARYPDYGYAIKVFTKSPQIALARFRVAEAAQDLVQRGACLPRVMFVTSTLTGGTPQTNRDLMLALSDTWEGWELRCDSRVISLFRMSPTGNLDLVETHQLQEPISAAFHKSFEYDRVLTRWMANHTFDLVHIRQLIWHSLGLIKVAKEARAVVINSFHDFYTLSPSIKLLDEDSRYCGPQCGAGQAHAISDLWPTADLPRLGQNWLDFWQQKFNATLQDCDAFVTTSQSARTTLLSCMPANTADRFVVIPHGRDFVQMNQLAAQITASMPIRILVPGSISVAKGLAVIEGLLDRDAKDQRLEFHILGGHNFTKERRGLHFHGSYRRDDFAAHVAQIAPHVGAVFSIWNETYCHTLTEMWAVGLPVMGSDYPTVADRIKTADAGWVYDDGDLDKLYTQILHDVDNAKGVAARQQAVMAWQLGEGRANTTRAMASKYHALYQAVWQNHKTVDDPNADPIDIYSTQSRRVAVLCHLDDAGKRVRFCTKNSPDRRLTYLPMTAAELVAAVGIGDIDKAILQVGAIADED
ncbi:MAG: GT2 family glycosyltransferase/glycosyltransferase involved in cell wall biosynthesis, partial [Gammaproteobacteria bacterium]